MTQGRREWPAILLWSFCLLFLSLQTKTAPAAEQYWEYTVRPGDTIWALTSKYCTDVLYWQRIQRLNNLPDITARGILPGTRIRFPIDILKHQPVSAYVRVLQGKARLVRMAGDTLDIAANTEIRSGDRLLVETGNNVTVRFADGSELLVLGGSEVIFDSLSAYGDTGMVDTRIRLQRGQVNTRVKSRQGPGSRYEIITPAAVAAVRGTRFRVAAESERPVSRSEVIEGTVAVSGSGAQRRVPAGYGVLAKVGAPPEQPRTLLPAPDLSSQQSLLDHLPLQFGWDSVNKAAGYRFQVAANASFDSLLADETTPGVHGFLPDLPNGDYVLRVRAIDVDGLQGIDAMHRFTVAAHPQPPVLIGLNNNTIIRDSTPEFGWSQPGDIEAYHFQVARDSRFDPVLQDEKQYRGERITPVDTLVAGEYCWRVASIDVDGNHGPWSDAATFEYRAVPESVALESPALGESAIDFQWGDAGEGMHYQFQLDDDPDLPSPFIDQTVSEPRITIEKPGARQYFFRVRAIDDTGYAGPWSTAQAITVPGSLWQLLMPAGMLLLL